MHCTRQRTEDTRKYEILGPTMESITVLVQRLQEFAQADELDSKTQELLERWQHRHTLDLSTLREAASQVADELIALQSIYGEQSVTPLVVQDGHVQTLDENHESDAHSYDTTVAMQWDATSEIRLSIRVPVDLEGNAKDPQDVDVIRLVATLPAAYPMADFPPRLQLLDRYIGPHSVDHVLFGKILRIFRRQISDGELAATAEADYVFFQPGQVVLFDGTDKAREIVEAWYNGKEAERKQRDSETSRQQLSPKGKSEEKRAPVHGSPNHTAPPVASFIVQSTSPIVERKSTFIGHAATLQEPAQVPLILSQIMRDRRVARATHPTIHAWICRMPDGTLHRDCDDDGESAAGGRLAHLLDLLVSTYHLHNFRLIHVKHVENVLVVVTRWYGGVMLGPDRFKIINRAAREALQLTGHLDGHDKNDRGRVSK